MPYYDRVLLARGDLISVRAVTKDGGAITHDGRLIPDDQIAFYLAPGEELSPSERREALGEDGGEDEDEEITEVRVTR